MKHYILIRTVWIKEKEERKKRPKFAGLSGVGEKTQGALIEAGFKTLAQIAGAEISALTKIKGIGKKKAEKLIAQAKELKGGGDEKSRKKKIKADKGE